MEIENLYKQIIHWLATPDREDWHEIVKKFVVADMIENDDYRKIFECLASSRDVLEHELTEGQGVMIAEALDMQSYKPLSEKSMVYHLHEITRAKNRARLKNGIAEVSRSLQDGKSGEEISAILNEIKGANTIDPGKTIQDIQAEIDSGMHNLVSPKTGIKIFDEYIKGFHKGHTWIIGAYAGAGKSLMCQKLAYNASRRGAEVLFFSLEMSCVEVTERINKVDKYADKVGVNDLGIVIYDGMRTLSEIEAIIRRHAPQVVFVDFIQLVQNRETTEYAQMTQNAIQLQRMAKELGVCMICASQFSNDYAKMQSLQTINYKGSGAIAQVADVGIILHRDFDAEDKNNEAKQVPMYIYLRKNKHGRSGKTKIEFDKELGLMFDREFILDV